MIKIQKKIIFKEEVFLLYFFFNSYITFLLSYKE